MRRTWPELAAYPAFPRPGVLRRNRKCSRGRMGLSTLRAKDARGENTVSRHSPTGLMARIWHRPFPDLAVIPFAGSQAVPPSTSRPAARAPLAPRGGNPDALHRLSARPQEADPAPFPPLHRPAPPEPLPHRHIPNRCASQPPAGAVVRPRRPKGHARALASAPSLCPHSPGAAYGFPFRGGGCVSVPPPVRPCPISLPTRIPYPSHPSSTPPPTPISHNWHLRSSI